MCLTQHNIKALLFEFVTEISNRPAEDKKWGKHEQQNQEFNLSAALCTQVGQNSGQTDTTFWKIVVKTKKKTQQATQSSRKSSRKISIFL